MNRSAKKHTSSSFTKFVSRLQRSLSSANSKSSTFIIERNQSCHRHVSNISVGFQLSDILYNPSRSIEYLSEIKDDSNSFSSSYTSIINCDDEFNLSKMNISINNIYVPGSPQKRLKLPDSLATARLHSTAIHEISHY